jgi:hypothetical protein
MLQRHGIARRPCEQRRGRGRQARARALLSLENFREAEASANEAIRINPEDSDTHVVLADKALSLEPESESARGLRAVTLAMSEPGSGWDEAAGETLAVAPDSALAHALAGEAHLLRGGEREAAERFREALRLDPESEYAQAGLAEAMKAAHPLFKPLFRFFIWQERLSTGWKVALTIGPLLALRALRPAADNPLVIGLAVLWITFVAATWLSVPIANVALRFSAVGRAVLPRDQRRSSTAFLAFVAAALFAVVLCLALVRDSSAPPSRWGCSPSPSARRMHSAVGRGASCMRLRSRAASWRSSVGYS